MRNFPFRMTIIFVIAASLSFAAEREKYWLFFKDKGKDLSKTSQQRLADQLDERAKWRRAKVTTSGEPLVDLTDLPVHQPYIDEIVARGFEIVVTSRWLNAVTIQATAGEAHDLAALAFIREVKKVAKGKRKPIIDEAENLTKPLGATWNGSFDYGTSITQNEQIGVPDVHSAGITGEGVLIAVLDAGFNLDNEAFTDIDIVATYDFINDDENVDNEPGDAPNQNSHGTQVLSVIGGFAPGKLIGPAFDAGFLLAKTEDVSSETEIEEDFWIAAAEWAEAHGADIITTSLGYYDWYDYSDMNGQKAPITIAADMAVKKGIVVVTSAGNEGNTSWYHIGAPADGFDVIAVGAVNSAGTIAAFSSRGPTSDGRIKPEVVAMGVSCTVAYTGGGFGSANGTSFSCPLVAGAAALILSAHPQLTPKQVRQALIQTAAQVTQPDNTYGFGLINALDAANYHGNISDPAETTEFVSLYPNPYSYSDHGVLFFIVDLVETSQVRVDLYNLLGQSYGAIIQTTAPAGQHRPLRWNGATVSGRSVPSGVYFYRLQIGEYRKTGKITLLH
ncbi:S8 family peptidase [candidate division KSB1 bacterium]|nr:S8 family peptidase [candidate division KSB1 bacterium]